MTPARWTPFGLTVASALLLVLVFPQFRFVWLAPVCLVPLLIAAAREPDPKRRLLAGWAGGIVYWGGVCYWIHNVLAQFGGMSLPLVWLAFALFAILRALPWAAFALLAGYGMRSAWALPIIAALWTGLERVYGPFGFAWLVLGNAGIEMGVPMRLAPVTGVYGLSFILAMMNAAVAMLLLRRPRRELAPLLALPLLFLLPELPEPQAGTETAVYVQPNIQERTDWTGESIDDTLRVLVTRSLQSGLSRSGPAPSLVLWPEVPAPFYYDTDLHFREQAAQLARLLKADFLFGTVGRNPQGAPMNSVYQVGPDGSRTARYDKVNLVPFGETVPEAFSWVGKISEEAGNFAPGPGAHNFPVGRQQAGVFICYESVFPHYVRQFTAQGAGVLLNLSNDGYFGSSAAREQHLAIVRMRAAENSRWILRSTNDGITVTLDPAGRLTQRLPPFQQTAARTKFSYRAGITPYVRWGDWFVWSCLVAGVAGCLWQWRRR